MSFELRTYQSNLIEKAGAELIKHNSVIFCSPTGSGKTVMFSWMIESHLRKDLFNRVLVVTHRTELFFQTAAAINRTGRKIETIKAGDKLGQDHKMTGCIVAMVETLKRRNIEQLGKFTLIIIDEAHRADFFPIVEKFPDTLILGATATPISASKKRPLKSKFKSIVTGCSVNELIEQGYLSPAISYAAEMKIPLKKRAGEYTDESQYEAMGGKVRFGNLVKLWRDKSGSQQTIVFCIDKRHTYEVAQYFQDEGIRAEALLSGTKDRDGILSRFKSGETQVLVNCEIATTGFDVPSIECVLINRATASLPLWLQMCGRGSRIYPGKDSFTIIDFGGNLKRHGMWEDDRDWKDWFLNPPKPGEGIAPNKKCPECEAIVPISITECPYCKYQFPSKEQEEAENVIGYLVRITGSNPNGKYISQLTPGELVGLVKTGVLSRGYGQRIARGRGYLFLRDYASLMKYNSGWVYHQNNNPDKQFHDKIIRL